jgi:osmotically-inducible protein OsmY
MATKTILAVTAALGCSLLAGGAAWASATETSQQQPSDARITREVQQKLVSDFPQWGNRVAVTTQSGVVTLSGTADTFVEEEQALEDAHGVQGVTDVRNRMHVAS